MAEKTKTAENTFSPARQLKGWANQGIESFMAAQRIFMDLTAQQNALMIRMLRERLSNPIRPSLAISKIAEDSVHNATQAGKILLDLAAGTTQVVVDGVKEALPLPMPATTLANVLKHRLVTLIDLQKGLLEAAAEQTHEAAEAYREGKGLSAAGASLVGLVRRGMRTMVDAEKKFLDLTVHEVSVASRGEGEHKPTHEPQRVLAEMARQEGENWIDAQRKLLNLAVEQIENVGKNVKRNGGSRQNPQTSWGELTEKSVRNFAMAQKSLLDLMVAPAEPTHRGQPERKRRSAQARPKRVAKVVVEERATA